MYLMINLDLLLSRVNQSVSLPLVGMPKYGVYIDTFKKPAKIVYQLNIDLCSINQ